MTTKTKTQKTNKIKYYYYKVLAIGVYLLGYTSCKDSFLKESIKEGWKASQLTFVKLIKNK